MPPLAFFYFRNCCELSVYIKILILKLKLEISEQYLYICASTYFKTKVAVEYSKVLKFFFTPCEAATILGKTKICVPSKP